MVSRLVNRAAAVCFCGE